MRRILITGMSGTGKSSVIQELAARGYKAIDTDWDPRWQEVNGNSHKDIAETDWVWREDKVQALLDTEDADIPFISACVPNQGKFNSRFDHIFLLSAPVVLMVERLARRTNNPYGKKPQEVADVLRDKATIEPLLRKSATVEIDTSIPLAEVVSRILALASPTR